MQSERLLKLGGGERFGTPETPGTIVTHTPDLTRGAFGRDPVTDSPGHVVGGRLEVHDSRLARRGGQRGTNLGSLAHTLFEED